METIPVDTQCPFCGKHHAGPCAPSDVEPGVMPPPPMGAPKALPRCEHGGRPGWCMECQKRDQEIAARVKPLADEFWDHRGARDIEHLLLRAYLMGMKHAKGA